MKEKFVVFKGKKFYAPYKCLCCGREVSVKQFCWGRLCAYCDVGKCQRGGSYEKGHNRKDIFLNAEELGDELQEIMKEKLKQMEKNGKKT